MERYVGPVIVVVSIYLLTLLVLLTLSILGPIGATVEGLVDRGDGTVWFTAAGVVGSFVLIAGLGILAVRWLR